MLFKLRKYTGSNTLPEFVHLILFNPFTSLERSGVLIHAE